MAALNRFISKSIDKCVLFFNILRGNKQFKWTKECEEEPPVLAKPITGETLFLYLAILEDAISAAIVREEGKHQQPIYYVSKRLLGAESRFGIPIKIVSDNGTQFDGDLFIEFCERNKIVKSFSSKSRPQAIGQVEAINKTLKDTIKKKLDSAKGRWVDEPPQVLWAHITTKKIATGHTPFSLAFGSEEMLPVEVNISTHRR
ncbi:uncharacterized protein LOC133035718 [Cannabis sativa]|uniref:uncharacterized protein LOC133035718 n=1 Tax=Cannabis sativa TaxID=3483 RepID=UPI0029C9F103|nr:uncharacterized protein LOC133035718 [Cannabis sativa]